MARGKGIPVLAPSENLLWEGTIKGTRIAITNLRLIVTRGLWLKDVLLSSIHSVELTLSLRLVILGLFIALVLPAILILAAQPPGSEAPAQLHGTEFLPLTIVGLVMAAYGWINRYCIVIHYTGGKIVLRGDKNAHQLMIRLREALLGSTTTQQDAQQA
ncbi:hypothetical protein Pyrde_1370 [Pyrodictium delaneyi]|uniref:Uncharacterized protein n=1 Tax=Pyrodictium delaneyi TaxID=1273541 RepID=A0A0P0N579_9CREN|nr:hypothetical protein [Pyrodictium delaneyi]ALL01416.1 hypothetical protein Pyrde_1370 [Pyrodictium delaneyi]OWJ54484.1 hypothetical protein Pdsh_06725 [Pyrodictium delaneyi]OWJ54664.1 hypothetical protein Pdsh_06510 [Pyrodictium delaneyi]